MIDLLVSKRGRLFVVSGPSGVGKGTVIAHALSSAAHPSSVGRCITATTRPPRDGEQDGVNYLFLSEQQFEERARARYFLEHVSYNGYRYGTPRDRVLQMLDRGEDAVLEIEVRGGLAAKEAIPDATLIFLAPPSWHELERRLRSRGTDSAAEVDRRLAIAREEMEVAPRYDYVVVNDDVRVAAAAICAIFIAERHRIAREHEA
jgi:guanylate kinase